jgi:amidase
MVASSDDVVQGIEAALPARPRPSDRASVAYKPGEAAGIPFWSAARLARAIREKKLGALELLDAYLARIEKHNARLRAVVDLDVAGARKRARAADDAVMRGEPLGPLHGVPMTVKDSIDVAGLASTWGIPELKDNRAAQSAPAVDALVSAGAIPFGKTNVPLALMSWETFNDLYGTTNNPWDTARSPGGSSGGSAAALAAGLTALEIGSDSAGSMRGPAHYCGIYGHKPTFGVVSVEGQSLSGFGPVSDIMVFGPMARSAEDIAISLQVMAGPDRADAVAWRVALPPPRHTRLSDFKVAVMFEQDGRDVDNEVRARLAELAEFLVRQGARVSLQARPEIDFDAAHGLFLTLASASAAGAIPDPYFKKLSNIAELSRRRSDSELASAVRGYTQSHRDWLKLDLVRNHLRASWASFFREYDVLLTPVAATAALPHDQSSRIDRFRKIVVNGKRVSATDQWLWVGLPAIAYLPATIAPAGFTSAGLPVGVQIIGPQYGDHTCIAFARLLEQQYQAFIPPKGWE